MGLFTGIGDFFRGAFGEDEEEKRRRKERERQAAQARVQKKPQQAPQPNPPKTNFQQQSIQNKQKPFSQVNKVAETATKTYQEQQNPSKARKELDELKNKHLARALEEGKNRTSWFDRQFTNRNWDKTAEATAMRRATAEYQDKYGWTKDPEVLDYLNQSKNKLDEAQKNGVSQWIAPVLSTGRVGTGMVQGGAGLYDLVTPGKGTNRVSQASTKKAEEIDQLAKDLGVNNLYKTTNVIGEVASYLIPGTAAAKVASKFPKGTKITADVIEKIASKVDNAGEANKVRQFLANQMRRNFTLDEALQETAITGRYMGQNTAQGGDTSPLSVTTDILTGFAGGILVPTKLKKGKNTLKDTEADDATGAVAGAAAERIDSSAKSQADEAARRAKEAEEKVTNQGLANSTDEELRAVTDNEQALPNARDEAQAELDRRNNQPDQTERPAYERRQEEANIAKTEEENFNRYINEHPELTPQQIEELRIKATERVKKLIEDLRATRQANDNLVNEQGEKVAEQIDSQQQVVEDVKSEQADQTNPDLTGTEAPNPAGAGDPEMAANNAYNDQPKIITKEDLSTDDARRSPEVTTEEFLKYWARGKQKMENLQRNSSPPQAIEDPKSWNNIIDAGYNKSREEWGGMTIDVHTGKEVPADADAYALTIRDPGMDTVSVSPNASIDEFRKAMELAKIKYKAILEREGSHLGIFHDVDSGRIDIDPVLVTTSLDDVHDIGAYTNAVGGAYHFKSGDGFWAPHVNTSKSTFDIDKAYEGIDSTSSKMAGATKETTNPILKLINAARRNTTDKYRSGVDFVRNKANDLIYDKTIGSNNNISAAPTSAVRMFFDKFGIKDIDRMDINSYSSMKGANEARVKAQAREIEEMMAKAGNPEETSKRLYQVFEEPDMLARMYGEGTPKISPDNLTSEERLIFDRLVELNKVRNEVWFRILQERRAAGLIDDKKLAEAYQSYVRNKSGLHSPRIYDLDLEDMGIGIKGNSNKGAYIKRKDVAELPQEVIDSINANPAQSMLFRLQTGLDELGRIQAVKQIVDAGYVRDVQPNKNWVKLEGQQYGAANGKYVDSRIVSELENRHIFTSDAGQKASDLLDMYRNSILGAADRAVKRAKTAYSPGTFLGNLVSNPLFFNRGSGVNFASQSYGMAKNVPALVRHMKGEVLDPDILEMQRLGIKLGNTTDELVGGKQNYRVLDDKGALTKAKDIVLLPNQIYAGADDLAKVTIFKTLKSRGMDSRTAALRASQFTQDYANAGRVVQMLADSPILGAPFARFVPELLRLTKNNIVYNPVGTFAGLYAIAAIQKELNDKSGETPEERAARENAPGKVKIPFTSWINRMVGLDGDISLDFPVGDSAINAARALGFNFPIEPGSDATESLIRNLAPFTIPFRTGPNGTTDFEGQMIFSSMALRPLAEQWANEDFMGRKVDDPTNKIRWEKSGGDEMKYTDNLSPEAKRNNRLYHLFMNWSPLASETDAVATEAGVRDALTQPGVNDGGKDYYGKDRTPMQAFLRSLGVKVENNDAEARQRRMDMNEYFEQDKPKTDAWLNENPDLADAYWKIRSTTRDRYTDVSANGIISPEKYKLIAGDQSGRLFNFFKQQAIDESNKTNTPLDPIYTLPPDQANQVVQLKAMNTGDDMKFQQLLYKENWFKGYKEADRKYQNSKPEYEPKPGQAKQNPRPEEWYALSEDLYSDEGVKSRYPLVKQYQDAIDKFANYDSDERREFTKNWYAKYGDAYKEEKANYEAERLAIVNKMRGIEGAPPMSPEVWSGQFETDEDRASGYGYGYGGGGGGSDIYKPLEINNITGLTNYSADVNGFQNSIQEMPQLAQFFKKLQASGGGGRQKPKIGASSSGQ